MLVADDWKVIRNALDCDGRVPGPLQFAIGGTLALDMAAKGDGLRILWTRNLPRITILHPMVRLFHLLAVNDALTENAVIIGSINMDLRSFYQQFECAVYTNDERVMSDVHFDFLETFKDSRIVTKENVKPRNLFKRIFAGIMQIFAPFM
jgi:phosphatidylserine/phosphatidylglycerophosphate/cardiolipin synthase-like enzyme